MHHSSRREKSPQARPAARATIVSLVLLGLLAVVVVVGTSVASAMASWRSTTTTTGRTAFPAIARSEAEPSPASSAPSVPSGSPSPPAASTLALTSASSPPATTVLSSATIPGGIDLDAGVLGIAPPPTIADDCSVDVSLALQAWLSTLAPETLVRPPTGACYQVDRGITLRFPQGLTIDGGTYKNTTTVSTFTGRGIGDATFTVVGGSHMTFEDLTIEGANPGGYHPALAFDAGIELQGAMQAVIRNVAVDHVYGDGISLDPLRGGSDHMSGNILSATTDLTIDTVDITGSGRQGIALVSVNTAAIDDVALSDVGIDSFDVEADQVDEGTKNVTIDGCTSSSWNGGAFFANGGASNGSRTGDIVVENCQMLHPQGGDAVLVDNIANANGQRGPFTFSQDTLWCGASVYVGCFQLSGATVSVTQSIVQFPKKDPIHEDLFHAGGSLALSFAGDNVQGWTDLGQGRASSTISISGGSWNPPYDAATAHSTVTVSHADTPHHVAVAAAHIAAVARRTQRRAQR